jgi:flagellar hook protein FlgE
MSSGAVTPQFTHDITVYDAQGQSHTVALNFVKLATNKWAVEATAVPASDVVSTHGDGLIGSGIISFNGDGSLATDSLPALTADWTGGAAASTISVDFGLDEVAGGTAQTTQAAGASTMQATQNGAPTGELTGVSIDQNGFVIAGFSNGQTQKLYQIPLAVVNNPDGLEGVSGDAYQQTLSSGEPTLNFANQGGAGQFTPSALEQSNVDLSTQLTNLIVAQQAYGANSKVLTIADQLLQQLDQIIQ